MQESRLTNTRQLAELVEQKHACLVQLLEIGARQEELIQAGDMTQLLRVLTSKHSLIAALQRIERDLTPFRDQDPQTRVWSSAEARADCAEKAALCRELLDDVVRQEKFNESLLLKQREAVADRLGQVHAAARASGAYRMHARSKLKATGPSAPERATVAETGRGGPVSGLDLSSDIR
jgi:hypothetical protein